MLLREVRPEDLEVFFEHQQDNLANLMAAFAPKNPRDRGVFDYHWATLLGDEKTEVRTMEHEGQVVGAIICEIITERDGSQSAEISFWTDRAHWGKGFTTSAVDQLLSELKVRPVRARVPSDNLGSQKVLTRRGFGIVAEERIFSNARAEIITEYVLELR